jgi:peptide subunit release factor 1 (eRF1)
MIDDLPERYREYLDRFTREVGEHAVGAFAKHRGKLIKKMAFEEFTPAYLEYTENDVVLRMLRDQAIALVLAPP